MRKIATNNPILWAAIIIVLIIVWMSSGSEEVDQSEKLESATSREEILAKVKVKRFVTQSVDKTITLYGRTEPNRVSTLKAEIKGRIDDVLAEEGSSVQQGDPIVRIALNDLPEQLVSAKALVKQRELEHQGALELKKSGYQAKTQVADTEAKLAAAQAELKRLEFEIRHATITAPFSAVLNNSYVEQGDYVKVGDNIAMVAELDPLIVKADVNEANIGQIELLQSATVRFISGQKVEGQVRYISQVADPGTNTFKIEVAIKNEQSQTPAGISAEVILPLFSADAIKVSPALLALDESGNIGIKTVKNDVVKFTPIDIVKSESDGMWLTGLDQQVDVIVVGQGFVRDGDKVIAVYTE